ncbi:MAG TPA: helix-turn-helix transcriptional regulator, partial [Thermomicrobiales bacterium]|nr:helix-turn-helix transcriptional regulator [Thermomicrobiales bacterium]
HARGVQVEAVRQLLAASPFDADEDQWNRRLGPARPLTLRELSIIRLLAVGLTVEELSDILSVSVDAFKLDISRLFEKLGVTGRTAAVHRARELGLLHARQPDSPPMINEAAKG